MHVTIPALFFLGFLRHTHKLLQVTAYSEACVTLAVHHPQAFELPPFYGYRCTTTQAPSSPLARLHPRPWAAASLTSSSPRTTPMTGQFAAPLFVAAASCSFLWPAWWAPSGAAASREMVELQKQCCLLQTRC